MTSPKEYAILAVGIDSVAGNSVEVVTPKMYTIIVVRDDVASDSIVI